MAISLTDFVDFVSKVGTPRLTQVKQIKSRGTYDPAEDFWRRLRNGIIDFHKSGSSDKRDLNQYSTGLSDKKKRDNYPMAVAGYKKFLGRKQFQWFDPPTTLWSEAGLDIRVNPELGLISNGKRQIIKLYFKKAKLTKAKADMILLLMCVSLEKAKRGDTFCILDVQQNRLFSTTHCDTSLLPLLKGEASAFKAIWDQLD